MILNLVHKNEIDNSCINFWMKYVAVKSSI